MKTANKSKNAAIALFLLITIAFTLVILPANAHDPPWKIPTRAYLTVAPNPIGVGQKAFITMWLDKPLQGAGLYDDVRHSGFKLTITKPDGKNETQTWGIIADTTAAQFTTYTPAETGTYSFVFDYPGLLYTWNSTTAQRVWTNDTYLPNTSRAVTLIVQEEPLPEPIGSYPLPREYWTRPIEGQNTDWWKVSSNWFGTGSPQWVNQVQPDGPAPNSAHVMWTKTIQNGGVVGGDTFEVQGQMFYTGMSYNGRFPNPIIMNGILYYK